MKNVSAFGTVFQLLVTITLVNCERDYSMFFFLGGHCLLFQQD